MTSNDQPFTRQPWDDYPLPPERPAVPAAEELDAYSVFADPTFEVMESRTVGESTYVRAYQRGSEEESLWVHRAGESEQLMTSGGDSRPRDAYRTMTRPDAPTTLYEQMVEEGNLWADQARDDEKWERKKEKIEYEESLDNLAGELAEGEITQAEYDQAVANLQPIADRLALYEVEAGQAEQDTQVLAEYESELTEAELSAEPLTQNDFTPPTTEQPAVEPDDDFDIDL
ncbi:hypothetical protein ACFQ0M_48800 [Kitasatospora aburaviensis]|uniref:Uncharacterized protein n=1 Tax=Kitasatospora aburaviensis TaxID=67265 RepID=A0ABW1F3D6_9ACTN